MDLGSLPSGMIAATVPEGICKLGYWSLTSCFKDRAIQRGSAHITLLSLFKDLLVESGVLTAPRLNIGKIFTFCKDLWAGRVC